MSACAACGHEIPEGAKFCSECGAPVAPAAAPREQRKTVTILFCDVAGSTELGESTDPEALRAVLARYFERMKEIVERHEGSVEKFIGDAVMAVFGVPVVHEDDALRACRAAVEMRNALPELGIRGRIGINTGEVVTGTEERLATGDAVNVAARLEQAAEPDEVLVGAETVRLVRGAVELGEERLLEVKGKLEPVAAYPLVAAAGEISRRFDIPIVGRERERRALDDAWERVRSERACHLFTILGAAGVGKSRLTAEFLGSLDDVPVVRGRCLSYGEGITYWPVVETVLQLGRRPSDPRAAAAIASLLGESEEPAAADEIAWAFRKLLEESAPVVCVFDDLHWAEPTFLDLVDHVADWSRDAPILLVCIARPELLDRRSTWAGGKLNATTVLLEPLTAAETDELIELLLGDAGLDETLRGRIRDAAEGNPLFVEQMLAMVGDSGHSDVVVPPTIQALLAARLDQLDPSERGVLERGAVEGKVFHRGGVEALAPEERDVPMKLMALVRKELVRPDRAQLAGDDAFRFRHLLIRDAAYDGLPKAARAELHERFAVWLETHGGELIELDEILGYHLEQAHRYRTELGIGGDETERLALRAAERLGGAAERAALRQDATAAVALYERSVALIPDGQETFERRLRLIRVRMDSGDLDGARRDADMLLERTWRDADGPREMRARLARANVVFNLEGTTGAELQPLAEESLELFSTLGDDAGLCDAWWAVMLVEHGALRWRGAMMAMERMAEHAGRIGDRLRISEASGIVLAAYMYGPFPVEEAIAWCEAHPSEHPFYPAILAQLEGMRGNFGRARELFRFARERSRERGQLLMAAVVAMGETEIELYAGDAQRASEVALDGVDELGRLGEKGWLSTVAGHGAQALYQLGRDKEAWRLTEAAAEAGATDDVITQMLILQVRAKILARRGEHAEAERLAREAVAWAEPTDAIDHTAAAHRDLAIVLAAAGRQDEALETLAKARELYELKGHTVGVAAMEEMRAELVASLEA
ncbi:MAG TPA: adenylate/guanylate cyclase domain-containing protein [Gaiellaceae bacterium]|nr:adenylate/guanylate cyclase domain-containing protein [Gaiellaceae bacterium]